MAHGWKEEIPTRRDGSPEPDFFCARLVVTSGEARPVQARVVIAGLPEEAGTVVTRLFGAIYALNLTRSPGASWLLEDFIDGWGTNVYQLGACRVSPGT